MEIHNYIIIPDNLLISNTLVYFWLSIIVIVLLIPTKFINKMIDNLFFHKLIFIITPYKSYIVICCCNIWMVFPK
jgi:hypothetical protein